MKNEKIYKNKSGISMLALVVTIIVLLILAGITITVLVGENGIIPKTQEARDITDFGKVKEEILKQWLEVEHNNINTNITNKKVAEELQGKLRSEDPEAIVNYKDANETLEVAYKDYDVEIDTDGEITTVRKDSITKIEEIWKNILADKTLTTDQQRIAKLEEELKKEDSNASVTTGQNGSIQISDFNGYNEQITTGNNGNIEVSIVEDTTTPTQTAKAEVKITSQPQSQTVFEGKDVTFTVTVDITGDNVTYKWYEVSNSTGISGKEINLNTQDSSIQGENKNKYIVSKNGNTITLTIKNANDNDEKSYYCEIIATKTENGKTTTDKEKSNTAKLTVTTTNIEVAQDKVTVNQGETINLQVTVESEGEVTYQWYKKGDSQDTKIEGATSPIYQKTDATVDDAGEYYCEVTQTINGETKTTQSSTIRVEVKVPLTITNEPVGAEVMEGEPVSFNVDVNGGGTITYQWYKSLTEDNTSGTPITGATNHQYNIANTTIYDDAYYYCEIKQTFSADNSVETIKTTPVKLSIIGRIEITQQPVSQSMLEGNSASFTIKAEGKSNPVFTYQWYKASSSTGAGTPIAGANQATYTIERTKQSDNGYYYCVVTQSKNGQTQTAQSERAQLTVVSKVTITTNPTSVNTITKKEDVTFTVTPSGQGTMTYQWYYATNSQEPGTAISGATQSTYTIPAENVTTDLNGNYYYCVVTQTFNQKTATATSTRALLTVVAPVSVAEQPTDVTVTNGNTATFKVEAVGTSVPELTYQWYKATSATEAGTAISGATQSTYTTPATTVGDSGTYYYCVISQQYGNATSTVTSERAQLTVGETGSIANPSNTSAIEYKNSVSFTAEATGAGTITYQWYKNTTQAIAGGAQIAGATQSTYTIPAEEVKTSINNTYYYCIATQTYGESTKTMTSGIAKLTVVAQAKITSEPANDHVIAGQKDVSFAVQAQGSSSPAFTYQWYQNTTGSNTEGTPISGATSNTYTINKSSITTSMSGTYYYCVITQKYGTSTHVINSAAAQLTVVAPATITKHPTAVSVIAGIADVSFNAGGSGSGTLSFQWYYSTASTGGTITKVTGATSSTYNIPASSVTTSYNGRYYYAEITQTYNGQTYQLNTNRALLTVVAPVRITAHPANKTLTVGNTATFSFTATGTANPGLTYQWYKADTSTAEGVAISGATSTTYTTPTLTELDSGKYYYAIATQKYGTPDEETATATTNRALLTIGESGTITNPIDVSAIENKNQVSFTVTKSGAGNFTYQWYKTDQAGAANPTEDSTKALSGKTSATYTISASDVTTDLNNSYYYCIAKQTYGSSNNTLISTAARLSVIAQATISAQPTAVSTIAGHTATYEVGVTGEGTITYQWYSNTTNSNTGGTPISGATSSSYTTPTTTTSNNNTYYYCVVTQNYGTSTHTVTTTPAKLTVTAATTITTQPTATAKLEGNTATFTVAASGAGTLSYQWYRASTPTGGTPELIDGATNATYTTPATNVNNDNGKYYFCVVTQTYGEPQVQSTATSNRVLLTVTPRSQITTQPQAQSKIAGNTATFTVSANGEGTLSYQWYVANDETSNGTAVSGATGASYTTPATTVDGYNGKYYYVVVTQTYNGQTHTVTSERAKLTVVGRLAITTQPSAQNKIADNKATFNVGTTGGGTITYQWYRADSNSNTAGTALTNGVGTKTDTYTTEKLTTSDSNKYYYVVVTQDYEGQQVVLRSNTAKLTVVAKTAITTHPTSVSAIAGENDVTFTAGANGSGEITYQWYVANSSTATGTAINGATSAMYTIAKTNVNTSLNGKYYYCIATQTYSGQTATATTNRALLSVVNKATIGTQPSNVTVTARQTATFTTSVNGTSLPDFTYQWYVANSDSADGTAIAGENTANYTTPATTSADNGKYYYCVVTQKYGISTVTVTTSRAKLTVGTDGSLSSPVDVDVIAGKNSATFTVTKTGYGTFTYQWYKSNVNYPVEDASKAISGATSASYTIDATDITTELNDTYYYAIAKQTYGSSTNTIISTAAHLGVIAEFNLTATQPSDVSVISGITDANFSVEVDDTAIQNEANGKGTITYQWYTNTSNSTSGATKITTGGTAGTYVSPRTSNTATNNDVTRYYYAVVTQKFGSSTVTKTSRIAKLTITPAVTITNPTSLGKIAGDTATFSITANGTVNTGKSLTYQWYKADSDTADGTPISETIGTGAKTATYTTPATDVDNYNNKYYYCVVRQKYGEPNEGVATATSGRAKLTVKVQGGITVQPVAVSVVAGNGDVSFSCTAKGETGLTFEWYRNTTNSNSGGTKMTTSNGTITNSSATTSSASQTVTSTFTIPKASATDNSAYDNKYYYCVVKQAYEQSPGRTYTSNTVNLTLRPASYTTNNVYYDKLADAINAASNNGTVTQLLDTTGENSDDSDVQVTGKAVTFNNNGKTLNKTTNGITVSSGATLTISGNGTITTGENIVLIINNGTLIIAHTGTISDTYTGENRPIYNGYGGILDKTGSGTITSSTSYSTIGNYGSNAVATISAGTVINTNNSYAVHTFKGAILNVENDARLEGYRGVRMGHTNNGNGTLSMTGGTIIGTSGIGLYVTESSTVTITEGTIKSTSGIGIDLVSGTVNIGSTSSTFNRDNPVIQGETYGLEKTGGTWNFYNGILKGKTAGHTGGDPANVRSGYWITTENVNPTDSTYKTTVLKQISTLTLNKTALGLVYAGANGSITINYNGDGAITATSSNTAVATVSPANPSISSGTGTITITPVTAGTTTITISGAEGNNYLSTGNRVNSSSGLTCLVTVEKRTISITTTPPGTIVNGNLASFTASSSPSITGTWTISATKDSSNENIIAVTAGNNTSGASTTYKYRGAKAGTTTVTLTFTPTDSANNKVATYQYSQEVLEKYFSVTVSSTKTYYNTMATALAAVPSGGTIVQENDCTDSTEVTVSGKTVTFNNNGKTLNKTSYGITVSQGATLTVSGSGTITTADNFRLIDNSGTLTISHTGTISGTDSGENHLIWNAKVLNKTGSGTITSSRTHSTIGSSGKNAITTISNGTIISTSIGTFAIGDHVGATLKIQSNARIEGYSGILLGHAQGAGILEMTGGTIVGNYSHGIDCERSSTATITGGTITGKTNGIYLNSGTVNIGSTSSTFNRDNPVIQGEQYGLNKTSGTWNFYNGIIKGKTAGYTGGEPANVRSGYAVTTANMDESYHTAVLKLIPTLTIDPTTMQLTYTPSGATANITATYNGDGVITATSGNTDVATVSPANPTVSSGTATVTVTSANVGETTVTFSAAEGTNYVATSNTVTSSTGLVSTVKVKQALISYSAVDKTYNYDEASHTYDGVTITNADQISQGVTIYYSTTTSLNESNYATSGSTTKPTRTNAGQDTVYWFIKDVRNYGVGVAGSNKLTVRRRVYYDYNYLENDILGSKAVDISQWGTYSTTHSSKTVTEDSSARSGSVLEFTMNAGTSGGPYVKPTTALTEGQTYTWSVYVKASSNKNLMIGQEQHIRKEISVTTNWQRVTYTFTANNDSHYAFCFYVGVAGNSDTWSEGDKLYIHSLELTQASGLNVSSPVYLEHGATLSSLPSLSRTGYTANNWWTAPTGGSQVATSTNPTANSTTYYAHWTCNKYNFTLASTLDGASSNADYGTGDILINGVLKVDDQKTHSGQYYYGSTYLVSDAKAKPGYTYTGNSSYTGTIGTSAVTVTLTFTSNNYTVTFNGNGGTNGTSITKKYGEALGTLPTSSRAGYSFANWWTTSTGGTQITSSTTMPLNGATYYAHWTPNNYTLSVNPNGGSWSGSTSTQTFTQAYGTEKTIENPTRDGYSFDGWTLSDYGRLGESLHPDSYFANGVNGCRVYNNNGDDTVIVSRQAHSSDNTLGNYELKVQTSKTAQPGWGGFYQNTNSAANQQYVHVFVAKLPVGFKFSWAANAHGDGGSSDNSNWLTSRNGTGNFEVYAYQINCGSTGTFWSFGYVYVRTSADTSVDAPEFIVAYSDIINITNTKGTKYTFGLGSDASTAGNGTLTANWVDNTAPTITASDITYGSNLSITLLDQGSGVNGWQVTTSDVTTTPSSGWTNIAATTSSTTVTKSGLSAGTYNVWAKDVNGNATYKTVTVNRATVNIPSSPADKTYNGAVQTSGITTPANASVVTTPQELVVNGDGSYGDNTNFTAWTYDSDNSTGGANGSFRRSGGTSTIETDEYFALSTQDTTYTLSLDAKTANGTSSYYAMIRCYDIDKKEMKSAYYKFINGSTTILTQDLKDGDTVVHLADLSGWSVNETLDSRRGFIIWNYQDSTGFQYPAETYSRNRYKDLYSGASSINVEAGTITLSSAWTGGTITAGTVLSQCADGATFKYIALNNTVVPTTWTHYTGTISGTDYSGTNVQNQFPPYAVYGKVGFLWNYFNADDTGYITNVSVTASPTSTTSATNVGTYSVAYQLNDTTNYQWSDGTTTIKTVPWKIKPYNITSTATVASVANQTYTGNQIKPTPTVTVPLNGTTTLTSGTDYQYLYGANKDVGTNGGSITVTGKGNYTGSKNVNFNITKAANPISIVATQSVEAAFSASSQDIVFTGATNAQGDVTYSIVSQKNSSNASVTIASIPTSSNPTLRILANASGGTYTVVVRASATGNSNYNSGTADTTITVTIGKQAQTWTIPSSLTIIGGNSATITVTGTTYGSVSSSSSDTSKATASGLVVTGVAGGSATITVTYSGNDNFASRSQICTVTVLDGNYSVTASNVKTYYNTMATALASIPNNGSGTIVQEKNCTDSSTVTVDNNKTVTFNNNGKTLNKTSTGIIVNEGATLEIAGSGTITTGDDSFRLINNSGTLTISHTGTISGTDNGSQHLIWNAKVLNKTGSGTITSSRTYPTIGSSEANAITTISNGTVIGKTNGINLVSGTVNIGSTDSALNHNNPVIQGEQYGIYKTNGTVNFYNGILKGITAAYSAEPSTMRSGAVLIDSTETISDVVYKTAYLSATLKETIAGINETDDFLGTSITRDTIEKVSFATSKGAHTASDSNCWDVSSIENSGEVLLWATDTDNDGYKEVTIGQDGGVLGNPISPFLFGYIGYNINAQIDLTNFDTSYVTNMNGMFSHCQTVTELDVSNFDTSKVTNMKTMFYYCNALTELDVSHFNTANVTNMQSTFARCYVLTELDVSNFNTSQVENMYGMFAYCQALTELDVSHFNTNQVTTMREMFHQCQALTELDVSHFNTSQVTSMRMMFGNCEALTELDVSHFNTSQVTTMWGMFQACYAITALDVSHFDTAIVTDMQYMFENCEVLTELDVSHFNTSQVTSMHSMFNECYSLTELDVSNFNTSQVTDMYCMFYNCQTITELDVSNFNTRQVTDMYCMFNGCQRVTELDVSNFVTSNVTDMRAMFEHCQTVTELDVSNFNTSNVTNMRSLFNNCQRVTELDVSSFDTSNVTDMDYMFQHCDSLITIYASSSFVTTAVTTAGEMFGADYNLVGGAGTVYSSFHRNHEYAHIDGGTSNPGYFTGGIYTRGEEVTFSEDQFYVLSENKDTVTLLAKYCLKRDASAQVTSTATYDGLGNAGYGRGFSSTNYWSDYVTSAPFNLQTTEMIDKIPSGDTATNNAIKAAQSYGAAKGVTARLMTYEEADAIDSGSDQTMKDILYGTWTGADAPSNGFLLYWLGSVRTPLDIYNVDGSRRRIGQSRALDDGSYDDTANYGVRPVLIVPKNRLGAVIDYSYAYGELVEGYNPSAGINWRLFYTDDANAYLIADGIGNYALNSLSGWNSSTLTESNVSELGKNLNSKFTAWETNPNYNNKKGVAALLDTTKWTDYKTADATWAIGAPTLEMFVASYNATHTTQIGCDEVTDTGYKVNKNGGAYNTNQTNLLESGKESLDNAIYCPSSGYWWLASPSAYDSDRVMLVGYNDSGDLSSSSYNSYLGVRPLVSVPISKIGNGITITNKYFNKTNPISITSTQSINTEFSSSSQEIEFTGATNAQGTVRYSIMSQKTSSNASTVIASIPTSLTPTLKIRANAPAGTYTIVVRATAAGNQDYNYGYADTTITVTINH